MRKICTIEFENLWIGSARLRCAVGPAKYELVNGLVLDKRKRDDDDESPELKKVKLDPRLACLLQAEPAGATLEPPRRSLLALRYSIPSQAEYPRAIY
ncbi:hypothetical protein FJT64_026799 [Amphibalanus amphitrite]|uniref:Uncharacterized protein n=1 Tax=Amphibalanus amphitrite TaxID=1232801 RepID=A0A6A4WAH0_AMPAM|nr:hypothetical protein FJT64_026799 [Amphibalanus amphitrite]